MAQKDWRKMPLNRLLDAVGDRLSPRKQRLLACAAVRRLPSVCNGAGEQAVALAERFTDGRATTHELAAARFAGRFHPGHPAWAVCWEPGADGRAMVERALAWAAGQASGSAHFYIVRREEEAQADLLREIAAHLLQPVALDPLVRAWEGGVVVKLAQAVYEEQAFDRLPILGDALEEAGCADGELLRHCRQPGGHVRGCWAVDLLTGRG
jgi:hypothetical protein